LAKLHGLDPIGGLSCAETCTADNNRIVMDTIDFRNKQGLVILKLFGLMKWAGKDLRHNVRP
jgi:hypothetical protein